LAKRAAPHRAAARPPSPETLNLLGRVYDAMPATFRREFQSREDGLAYVVAVSAGSVNVISRKVAAPRSSPVADVLSARDAATGLRGVDLEWADPAVRAEFGGDKDAFIAFRKHELAGDVTVASRSPGVIHG
jgi:hypothetical protein